MARVDRDALRTSADAVRAAAWRGVVRGRFERRPVDVADGSAAAAAAPVIRLVRARGAVAQLCVIRDGDLVVDVSIGCDLDSLFWIFSASKPYVALLIHLLAERGQLSLDDPVAAYWPQFARRGKDGITVRHVLQHRSGMPVTRVGPREAVTFTDWERAIRRIERQRPTDPPGAFPAYQPLGFGFILGEIARRVTGTPLPRLLRAEILDPLGAHDTYLGLPAEQWPRHVPLDASGPAGALLAPVVNRRATRAAVVPAAGISTTARDLATFYLMLLRGGEGPGGSVLPGTTIEEARRPSSDGEIDLTSGLPTRWAQGFQLGGPRRIPRVASPFGQSSSPNTFGHNGSGCCIGWADPDRDLAVAYLTDRVTGRQPDARHQAAVADAIIAAFGG
jgi:CubicO group peptidase (beta-lactamase class C family)